MGKQTSDFRYNTGATKVPWAAVGENYGFDLDTPVEKFSKEALHALLYGAGAKKYDVVRYFGKEAKRQSASFDGIISIIERRMAMMGGDYYQEFIEEVPCPACNGARLSPEVLAVTVGGINIAEFCNLSVEKELEFLDTLKFSEKDSMIAKEILK